MTPKIICNNEIHGQHSFYLKLDDQVFHLFDQKFSSGIKSCFEAYDMPLSKAISLRSKQSPIISKTSEKIQHYAKRLEKELCVDIFESKEHKLFKCACVELRAESTREYVA